MCIPYIIADPQPRKRPRKSGLIARSTPPKSPRLQPAIIEISPRLTYVASPKPDRSPLPPRGRLIATKPPRAPEAEFLAGFVAGEQASRQEEGKVIKEEMQPTESKPKSTPPAPSSASPSKVAPPATEKATIPEQPQDLAAPRPKPKPFQPPPPPAPRIIPFAPPAPQPQPYHPTRSPYSYIRRPPPHHPTYRSRSLSSDSTISSRNFERLKRNVNVLWERVKVLEAEKEVREADRRRGKRGWVGRREGSLIRERRERGGGRGRVVEWWEWVGGGLGWR